MRNSLTRRDVNENSRTKRTGAQLKCQAETKTIKNYNPEKRAGIYRRNNARRPAFGIRPFRDHTGKENPNGRKKLRDVESPGIIRVGAELTPSDRKHPNGQTRRETLLRTIPNKYYRMERESGDKKKTPELNDSSRKQNQGGTQSGQRRTAEIKEILERKSLSICPSYRKS